jgi:hypothetical protein
MADVYEITAVKSSHDEIFYLSSVPLGGSDSYKVTRETNYWVAQQIERAIEYGKYLARQEIRQALGL